MLVIVFLVLVDIAPATIIRIHSQSTFLFLTPEPTGKKQRIIPTGVDFLGMVIYIGPIPTGKPFFRYFNEIFPITDGSRYLNLSRVMKDKVYMDQLLTSCTIGLTNGMATQFQLMVIKFTSLAEGTIIFPAILFMFLTQKHINGADQRLQGTFQHLVTAILPA